MAVLRIGSLPETALTAAAEFHAKWLPNVQTCLAGQLNHLALIFPPADHTHRAWRLAAIQSLARESAPVRVNGLASDSAKAITAALYYLESAEGVTGQLLQLDDTGAEEVVPLPA